MNAKRKLKRKPKRITSLLLALCMLMTFVPDVIVSAENDNNLTQIDGVYQISDAESLKNFIELVNSGEVDADAALTADIDMSGEEIPPMCPSSELIYDGSEITQLGYKGTFDGAGHKISGYTITPDENEVDLILAAGGGSTIDCAKGISVSSYCESDPWDKYWVNF